MRRLILTFLLIFLSYTSAQTVTTIDPVNGLTVVEVITVVAGLPATQTLRTLTGVTTATTPAVPVAPTLATTAVTTTTPAVNQGPVGQPAATLPGESETIYTYTTTDAAGLTTAIVAVFTPTFAAASAPPVLPTGTVLNYSSWRAMVGTNTVAASSGIPRWQVDKRWIAMAGGIVCGALGGGWLVLT